MAKNCANCGCKIGFMSGEHFDGLLCDSCFNLFEGAGILFLDTEQEPEKYVERYEKIVSAIDRKADINTDKERIKKEFYSHIDAKFKRISGLSIKEQLQNNAEKKVQENLRIQKEQKEESERVNYAKSFNEFYEYDVVTLINENHGTVDKEKMMKILSDHAKNGWKLHTMYSNELGKNALSLMGFGVNATACEDVMIFERRVKELD